MEEEFKVIAQTLNSITECLKMLHDRILNLERLAKIIPLSPPEDNKIDLKIPESWNDPGWEER
jgi:hypothetical protein